MKSPQKTENKKVPPLLDLTVSIVRSHVGRTETQPDSIPALLKKVHQALQELQDNPAASYGETGTAQPVVDPAKAITHDALVCLICGKGTRMLKRHLRHHHQMTPEQYRQRFGLPHDYPMVAESLSQKRQRGAKSQLFQTKPDTA